MSELADLLERFRRGAELIAVATTGAAGAVLDYRPTSDSGKLKWSVRMIVCHLADSEMAFGVRLRQVIAEDNPTMQAWDQDRWADHLHYETRKISDAMETLRRVRADNYELIRNLPAETFERAGNHTERGRQTLLDLVRLIAAHPEMHVQQIQAVRAAYKEYKAKQAAG